MPITQGGNPGGGGASRATGGVVLASGIQQGPLSITQPGLVVGKANSGATFRAWVPSDLGSKLKTWLKGDDLSGSNGSAITAWSDASGNSSNATPVNSPTLVVGGLGGLNTVSLAGASVQYFTLPTGLLTGRTQSASFAVFKLANDPPASGGIAGPVFGDFGSDVQGNHNPYTDGTIYDDYCTTARKTVGNPTPSFASWRIISFRSAASDWRCTLDGTDLFTTATNTVGTGTAPKIGYSADGGAVLDGQIAEIVDCNDFLTEAEKEQVEGYLAWKWGLQGNLPAGHTYKASVPLQDTASGTTLAPSAGHLALTGYQPALTTAFAVSPSSGHLVYSGKQPSVSVNFTISPTTGHLVFDGKVPSIAVGTLVSPSTGHLILTGHVPTLTYAFTVSPATGHLVFSGKTPGVSLTVAVAPSTGHLTYSGKVAIISLELIPATGHLTFTGYQPIISGSSAAAPAMLKVSYRRRQRNC